MVVGTAIDRPALRGVRLLLTGRKGDIGLCQRLNPQTH
jgi:hypothetical protein